MATDKKTVLGKVQEILDKCGIKLQVVEAAPVEFKATGKLKDGTEIYSMSEEWAVGADVQIQNAEGVASPAPDGEHILEDGRTIIVADGLITEIREASAEEMTAEQMLEVVEKLSASHKTVSDELVKVKTELAAITEEKTKAQTELAAAKAEVVKLSKAPAAASVTKPATVELKSEKKPKPFSQMTIVEKMIASRTGSN